MAIAQEAQPAPAKAAQPVNRPFAARRVVFQFDFEADPREVFELPRFWDLAQDGSAIGGERPGYPAWNTAGFDAGMAFSGSRSVRVTTKGGSASLRLEPGVVPVFPGTDYLVSGHVQTRGLKHARAAITVRCLDKANAPIAGSESRSELIATQPGEWRLATAPLPSVSAQAAYVQIDLELLQPEQIGNSELGPHQVWPQDYTGEAWFDQVAVVQLPRAAISTASPINILQAPERPKVRVGLRDLTGEQLTGYFTVQDAGGIVRDSRTQPGGGGAALWEWEPKLTEYGWYRATLELRTNQRRVGGTYVDFVWLPPRAKGEVRSGDAARFGTILLALPEGQRARVVDMLDSLGAGSVTIPVWGPETTAKSVDQLCNDLVPVMERLRATDRRVTLSMPRIPDGLASQARLDPSNPLALFASDQKLWTPYLVPFLDKYGQSVQRWHVGSDVVAARLQEPSAEALAILGKVIAGLVPGPVIEIPWPAEQASPRTLSGGVELLATLPHDTPADGIADVLAGIESGAGGGLFALTTLPVPAYSRLDSCIDLVKRATELWVSSAAAKASGEPGVPPSLSIVQPWDWPGGMSVAPMPRAEFAAWHCLASRLQDRRPAGRLKPAPGVTCIILAPGPAAGPSRTGAIVIWRDAPPDSAAGERAGFIDLFLGDEPVELVDIFGNRRTLAPTVLGGPREHAPGEAVVGARAARAPMVHHLPVSDAPLFVENVDVELAQFAAAFRLDPPFAASSTREHEIAMILRNPWKNRVEGRISVLEPGGLSVDPSLRDRSWRITPRSSSFSIGPGEEGRVPLLVAFSPVEEAGPKDFLVEIELAGTKDYGPLRMKTMLEIGVTDFQLDVSGQASGPDERVTVRVTNRGKAMTNYEVNGFADGYPRARANISDLPPGASVTRTLMFPGGVQRLRGQRISVGVQDLSTQSRATRTVMVE